MDLRLVLKNWTIWNISINFQMTIVNHGSMAAAPSDRARLLQFTTVLSFFHRLSNTLQLMPTAAFLLLRGI